LVFGEIRQVLAYMYMVRNKAHTWNRTSIYKPTGLLERKMYIEMLLVSLPLVIFTNAHFSEDFFY